MDMRPHLLKAVLVILAAAVPGYTQSDKPNLTGTWKLNTEKSDTGGQHVQDLIVKIEHKDPMFRYTAAGSAEGNNFEESAELSIGGKETTASNGLLVSPTFAVGGV